MKIKETTRDETIFEALNRKAKEHIMSGAKTKMTTDGEGREIHWNKGKPPPNVLCVVLCSDYMGEYQMLATWVPYSLKGPKRQHGKGRWMKSNRLGVLEPLSRKETPEGWIVSELNEVSYGR